jgi:hypothetical protein
MKFYTHKYQNFNIIFQKTLLSEWMEKPEEKIYNTDKIKKKKTAEMCDVYTNHR